MNGAAEVNDTAAELRAEGYMLIHETRTEPWGQVITRLLGPEGLLIGICFCPWMPDPAAVTLPLDTSAEAEARQG